MCFGRLREVARGGHNAIKVSLEETAMRDAVLREGAFGGCFGDLRHPLAWVRCCSRRWTSVMCGMQASARRRTASSETLGFYFTAANLPQGTCGKVRHVASAESPTCRYATAAVRRRYAVGKTHSRGDRV